MITTRVTSRTNIPRRTRRQVRPCALGFTLVEVIASTAIMSVLLAVASTAIFFTMRSIPTGDSPLDHHAHGLEVVDRIAEELMYATLIVEQRSFGLTFQVPDRGHGDAGAEEIQYTWSGTPGDPLQRKYNRGTKFDICDNVQDLSWEFTTRAMPLGHPPRVAIPMYDIWSPNAQDLAKIALMEAWGFTVQTVAADDAAAFEAAMAASDVIFVPQGVSGSDLENYELNTPVGLVTESNEALMYRLLGISSDADDNLGNTSIWIQRPEHEIMEGLGSDATLIFNIYQKHAMATGMLAPGAKVLSQWPGYPPTTVLLDSGAERYDGKITAGRRMALPWGDDNFDVNELNDTGRTILQRSIEWAATPLVFASAQVTLVVGTDPPRTIHVEVSLLNSPMIQGTTGQP